MFIIFYNVCSRGVRYPVPSNFYDYEDEDDTLWYIIHIYNYFLN
jgi:hypothetical protein